MSNPIPETSEAEQPITINFSEADHLFLDDLAPIRNILTSDAEVTALLYVIERISNEIDSLRLTKAQHAAFYDDRIDKAGEQIDFLKGRIERYLDTKGVSSLPTPNGTAFFTTREKYEYPDDQVLLEWARAKGVPIKVTEKVSKTDIVNKVKALGEMPSGMRSRQVRSLSLRSRG